MAGLLTSIIVLLALTVPVFILYRAVRRTIRRTSMQFFGTPTLAEGLENQNRELAETPKSVSSMTKIYLPLIQQDFPHFNLMEFKVKAENMLKSAFVAITQQDASLFKEGSADAKQKVQLRIAQSRQTGEREYFERVAIHQNEITAYTKKGGTCVITLQMAVGHLHYTQRAGTLVAGSTDWVRQSKYNVDLLYIQDPQLAAAGHNILGLNCPNCGAPVKKLGHKYCEFCGSGLVELNINNWSVHNFYELT